MENDVNERKIEFAGYEHPIVPPDLEDKTVQSLRSRGLLGRPFSVKRVVTISASLLLLTATFFSGWIFGKNVNTTAPVTTVNKAGNNYLLLLYNTRGFVESNAHVEEYGDWMRSLSGNNQIATGEELKREGWQISISDTTIRVDNQPVLTDKGRISGYFLIKASDDKKALEIALSCPHVKHKGMIELRPVQFYQTGRKKFD